MSFRGFARQLLGLGPASRARLREGLKLLRQSKVSADDVRAHLPGMLRCHNWEVRNVAIKLRKPTTGTTTRMEGLLADETPDLVFDIEDGSHDELYRLADLFMKGIDR